MKKNINIITTIIAIGLSLWVLYLSVINIVYLINKNMSDLDITNKIIFWSSLVILLLIIFLAIYISVLTIKRNHFIINTIMVVMLLVFVGGFYAMVINKVEYTTVENSEYKQKDVIKGEIVNKEVKDTLFSSKPQYILKIETKDHVYPVKLIVDKNTYTQKSEEQKIKKHASKVIRGVIIDLNKDS